MAASETQRAEILAACGAEGAVLDAVLAYNEHAFAEVSLADLPAFPLAAEPHLEAWRRYAAEADEQGVIPTLAAYFPQLLFPIEVGISGTEAYRRATLRGQRPCPLPEPGLGFEQPAAITLAIHGSLAGAIPVLITAARADFETLVRALSARNEPEPVPASMGACIVSGLNNWDRLQQYRQRWETENPGAAQWGGWAREREQLLRQKPLYQDRLLILGTGPYSGVDGGAFGFSAEQWLEASLALRREHELTHYFTLRVFGAMRKNILDELVADFVGLVAAFGSYRKDLALCFLGLESFPAYREGGRLENYLDETTLSTAAVEVLRTLVVRCVEGLAAVDGRYPGWHEDAAAKPRLVAFLFRRTLEELAAPELLAGIEREGVFDHGKSTA